MSYVYAGDSPDHGNQYLYAPGGLGVLGSLVPSTGEGGRPGLLYNDVVASGWEADQLRVFLLTSTFPSLVINDDSSWIATDLSDGVYTASFRVYRNGPSEGESTLTLTVGGSAAMSGAVEIGPLVLSGGFVISQPSAITGNVDFSPLVLGGGFRGDFEGESVASPLEIVRPSFDVFTSVWSAVGDSTISDSLNEVAPSSADFAKKDATAVGKFVVALTEAIPAGRHLIRIAASVTTGVGRLSIRLLGADLQPVSGTASQAVTGSSVTYILPIVANGVSTHMEVDADQLRNTSPTNGAYASEVVVSWAEIKTLGPYDGQNVPDA